MVTTVRKLAGTEPTAEDVVGLCASSWLTPEIIESAQIRRFDEEVSREYLGITGQHSEAFEGLAFPYFDPNGQLRDYRVRRFSPTIERRADGSNKEKRKYMTAPGKANMLYFPPGIDSKRLNDTELPVAITEGEKKTLALHRLSVCESGSPRFLPIGISGVWNWRGTIGKDNGPNGARRSVKGVLPDLDLVAWQGRQVFVVFDSDVRQNPNVQHARAALTSELQRRGSRVLWVDVPEV